MHAENKIDVFHLLSGLQPIKGRGRPTSRGTALQKTLTASIVNSLNPNHWRNASIRHSDYLGGVIAGVYLTTVLDVTSPFIGNRSLPNGGGTVWDVVFPDAQARLHA